MRVITRDMVRRTLSQPPQVTLRRALRRWRESASARARRRAELARPTYSGRRYEPGALARPASLPDVQLLRPHVRALAIASRYYVEHRFDVLGSGWVVVEHGMSCRGLHGHRYDAPSAPRIDAAGDWLLGRVNAANARVAASVWALVDPGYRPIDWHRDFKSGYRWPEDTWHRDIRYGHLPGVDVKVPWELARMQHLPQLALAHAAARAGADDFLEPERYAREFRNQVLDFIATNPPRFGVNWACTMDVAIRIANWLLAHDLLRAQGAEFGDDFEHAFASSVYDHASFIASNLEWSRELRANHYLADIAGLLVATAYLPSDDESDAWLALAVEELFAETRSQFLSDGANFEASTSYHRLSAEMVAYATAFVLALEQERFAGLRSDAAQYVRETQGLLRAEPPVRVEDLDASHGLPEDHAPCLEKMAHFVRAITKPDGTVPQVGDNDSGRFVKLLPVWAIVPTREARARFANLDGFDALADAAPFPSEIALDHRHLVAAIGGLLGHEDLTGWAPEWRFEGLLLDRLAGGAGRTAPVAPALAERVTASEVAAPTSDDHARTITTIIPGGGGLTAGLETIGFDSFGLFVFRSRRLYLSVRCGPVGQNGNGGHAHNDQLSVELAVDGEDWIVDPGTYLYTPLPDERNRYRSIRAHFAPRVGVDEPCPLDHGLFRLPDEARPALLLLETGRFTGLYRAGGAAVVREIVVHDDRIEIVDLIPGGPGGAVEVRSPAEAQGLTPDAPPRSPGYGVVETR